MHEYAWHGAASVQNTKQATGTVAVKATYSSLLTPKHYNNNGVKVKGRDHAANRQSSGQCETKL